MFTAPVNRISHYNFIIFLKLNTMFSKIHFFKVKKKLHSCKILIIFKCQQIQKLLRSNMLIYSTILVKCYCFIEVLLSCCAEFHMLLQG